MKQIIQSLKNGHVVLEDIPAPRALRGSLLIRTNRSLVSIGTERMLVEFGRASLWQKARSQPDKVRQVLQKIRSDGLVPTVENVFRRLDEPIPLGYSNAGTVIDVGASVTGFMVGDRVASNGPHAEVVCVPVNLCAKIPDCVSDDQAAFTVVGAIALQGIRLVRPTLGETVVVVGLGLIGLLTVQLLRASGCRVLGIDFDPAKVQLARSMGARALVVGGEADPVLWALQESGGIGVDAAIITASASGNEVISQCARMSRKRGRVVLVGVVGLQINRAEFYEKELTFQVSCSYGPGRYEDTYEKQGLDYPLAFVRWTENRNFQAVLTAMEEGALRPELLVSRRVPFEQCNTIYDDIRSAGIASLFTYTGQPELSRVRRIELSSEAVATADGTIAVLGAGNFTKITALPALKRAGARLKYVVSATGVTATHLARTAGIANSATDFQVVLDDPEVRGVVITTRHNLHAAQVCAALRAGKHVLVEKPLCMNLVELEQIKEALAIASASSAKPTLTVGFNRRFSPHVTRMRQLLAEQPGSVTFIAMMNAGAIPPSHWVHDRASGGGRLLGEACHFIDLAVHVTGSLITEVSASSLEPSPTGDTASVLLRHANGSISTVHYFATGSRELAKERVEAHASGRSLVLDNFCVLNGHGFRHFRKLKTPLDKGHNAQFAGFVDLVKSGGAVMIPWLELENSTRATFAMMRAIETRSWVRVDAVETSL